ncbi:MAG: sugar phosphate nucleotidyltransferase [Aquaticitalea sp.]
MNKNKLTLVILAAGIGSRYGNLKQMDVFTPQGDTIVDFSLYDALQAGFGRFVFIIRKNFETEFKDIFNKKLQGKAEVDYVFQEFDSVPKEYIDPNRTKPWGTGHALLMAKNLVKENFAVINADDFYGREAFMVMSESLSKKNKDSYDFSTMAYLLKNTVSDHGHVARGECEVDQDGYLVDVTERTHIEKIEGKLMQMDRTGKFVPIDGDTIVSMNFWGFTPKCFEFGEQLFVSFLEKNKGNPKAEFFITSVIKEILKSEKASIEVLQSDAQWFGVTYSEDKKIVQDAIGKLKEKGIYPTNLW